MGSTKDRNSLCWRIEKQGCAPSYIFGTFHLPFEGQEIIIEALSKILDEVSFFYAETNLDDLKSPAFYEKLNTLHPTDLFQHFQLRQIEKFRYSLYRFTNLDLYRMRHIPPLMILTQISSALIRSSGFGLDEQLWFLAERKGKICQGVESAFRQLEIYESMEQKVLYKQIKDLLKNLSKYKRHIHRLIQYYREQRIHQLYRMTKRDLGVLRKVMINERNELMSNTIRDHIMKVDSTPTLFTFGAGHLSGQFGIIKQLKGKGLKLVPKPIFNFVH